MKLIVPEKDLHTELLKVLMPGRYVGGEFGSIVKDLTGKLKVGLCFPDMYEIGMSNLAIKILYNLGNRNESLAVERVFAPAQDYGLLLKNKDIPLYTLENGIPLNQLDVLAFSIGFEMAATTILYVLESGHIPLKSAERNDNDPVILGGGPAITNPRPFEDFFDGIYIGEGEDQWVEILLQIHALKKRSASRNDILEYLDQHPNVWTKGSSKVRRAIWSQFDNHMSIPYFYPVPSVQIAQDHGIVEVMRGCPNGCRFCQAGITYRPFRQRGFSEIREMIDHIVFGCGYKQITLASLSSGDYDHIDALMDELNERYSRHGVSFNLPSLKINSFSLDLLSKISYLRKSGLTFAIETPQTFGQHVLNKNVNEDKVLSIMKEALNRGWKQAKFYFMLGLPNIENDAEEIIKYIQNLRSQIRMELNINIGTFVPKPHTPFQWSEQLAPEKAVEQCYHIKKQLGNRFVHVKYHDPYMSCVEGFLARGDEKASAVIEKAYRRGARFDAWQEYFNFQHWAEDLQDNNSAFLNKRETEIKLPWDDIQIGVSRKFLEKEWEKAKTGDLTARCEEDCGDNCGICGKQVKAKKNTQTQLPGNPVESNEIFGDGIPYLFSFEKTGKAIYLSHLNIIKVFEMAFLRSGIDMAYTKGFNPKPRMNFAAPLKLGHLGLGEIMTIELMLEMTEKHIGLLNSNLPHGFKFTRYQRIIIREEGKRNKSLMQVFGGSHYSLKCAKREIDWKQRLKDMCLISGERVAWIDEKTDEVELRITNRDDAQSGIMFWLEQAFADSFDQADWEICRIRLFTRDDRDYFTFFCDE